MNFYIADWHYSHKNIISYDNRPYSDVHQMNKALVENWNSAVTNEDTVYVLGDMFWCKSSEAVKILEQLNGNKVLIKGNHDSSNDRNFTKHFERIVEYLEIKDEDRNVVLCHYPIPCFKNLYYGWYHLYGHVHNSFEHNMMLNVKRQMESLYDKPCNMFNVGAMLDYMKFTPRTLNHIIENSVI